MILRIIHGCSSSSLSVPSPKRVALLFAFSATSSFWRFGSSTGMYTSLGWMSLTVRLASEFFAVRGRSRFRRVSLELRRLAELRAVRLFEDLLIRVSSVEEDRCAELRCFDRGALL